MTGGGRCRLSFNCHCGELKPRAQRRGQGVAISVGHEFASSLPLLAMTRGGESKLGLSGNRKTRG